MVTKFLNLSNDWRIAYIESTPDASLKSAPSLLYLSGFGSTMEGTKASLLSVWAKSKGLHFIRFDYRGCGESSGEFTDYGIDHWVEDASIVIEKLIENRVILIGSSMGGWIGSALSKTVFHKICGFIGIAAAPDFTQRDFWENFTPEQKAEIENGQILEISHGGYEPYQISNALIEGGRRSQVLNEPLHMPFPVRLFQGMQDRSVLTQTAVDFAKHIESDDLELHIVKNADHGFSKPQNMALIFEAIEKLIKSFRDNQEH